jgi:hypothetical protein
MELVKGTIPRSGGYNTPQRARDKVSKACFGVHTRDSCAQFNEERMGKVLVTAFAILVPFSGAVCAKESMEKKKIEFLLSSLKI